MKIKLRFVNRALTFNVDDEQETVRVKVLQVSVCNFGDVWTDWENVPVYDAEDVEAEEDAIADGNEHKQVEDLGL